MPVKVFSHPGHFNLRVFSPERWPFRWEANCLCIKWEVELLHSKHSFVQVTSVSYQWQCTLKTIEKVINYFPSLKVDVKSCWWFYVTMIKNVYLFFSLNQISCILFAAAKESCVCVKHSLIGNHSHQSDQSPFHSPFPQGFHKRTSLTALPLLISWPETIQGNTWLRTINAKSNTAINPHKGKPQQKIKLTAC